MGWPEGWDSEGRLSREPHSEREPEEASLPEEDEAMPDARAPWPGQVDNEDGSTTYPGAE